MCDWRSVAKGPLGLDPAKGAPGGCERAGAPFAARLVLLVVVLALAAASSAPAQAAVDVFQVTKQEDTADGFCDSDCSLREAIIAANADVDVSTINVPESATHYLITNGLGDDSGLQGDFDILSSVTIQGAGIDQTIVDGNALDTVFHVQDAGKLTLKGLTVRNGKAIGSSLGGGIFAEGDLTLDIVNVSENTGPAFGAGAIYAADPLSIEHSTISMNIGGNEGTGGIFANRETDIDDSTISGNTVTGISSVGGIHLESDARLVDVTVSGNAASGESSVGGLHTVFGDKDMDLRRVTISGNSAIGDYAVGGWWNATSVTAGSMVIEGNQGGDHGAGGVYVECCNGGLELSRAAITGNTGGDDAGGGIWNESALIITNVTVDSNIAGASGAGGVYNAGHITLLNVTIADNAVGVAGAGGFWNDDTATARNTIVTGGVTDCVNGDSITSEGGNFSLQSGCGFTQPTDHPDTDARLGALAENGGFSKTRALLPGSPAIDAGVNCPPPTTDQRGVERPSGGCDSGAYEVGELVALHERWGDVRCDGSVGGEDVTAVLHERADVISASSICPGPSDHVRVLDWFGDHLWGDVNCDENVNGLDALSILKDIAQLSVQPSACPTIGESVSLE